MIDTCCVSLYNPAENKTEGEEKADAKEKRTEMSSEGNSYRGTVIKELT